jgi:hypothetical protein
MIFIETSLFTKLIKDFLSDEDYRLLQLRFFFDLKQVTSFEVVEDYGKYAGI